MDRFNDIFSYVMISGVILGTLIPLIGLLISLRREKTKRENQQNSQKDFNPAH
jgi:hypothetical protein